MAAVAMDEVEAHQHGYRSPLSAIIGLAEAALARADLDTALVKQLRAIRALAQDALAHPAGWEAGTEAREPD